MKCSIQETCHSNAQYVMLALSLYSLLLSTKEVFIKLLDQGVGKQDGALGKPKLNKE